MQAKKAAPQTRGATGRLNPNKAREDRASVFIRRKESGRERQELGSEMEGATRVFDQVTYRG